jgi:alpha-soluble NSF attachment protein
VCAESANCLNKAAEYFTDLGRLSVAAKHFKDMGDIFEEQGVESYPDAIAMFSKAADLYGGEEVTSTSNGCKLKVAMLSALVEDYPTSVQLFQEVALSSLDSNLLKYSVKGYLLQAGLVQLCHGDSVQVANAIDKYLDMDATFEDTREHKLLVDLSTAMESGDVDQFTSLVQEFDSMSRLDQWKTTMLLRAKKRCAAHEMAGGEEDDLT